ncbi:MAG TPA: ABC transporter permease [Pyrinomonadaceae bacterium]|nr:ABC transporter permease [Pyrinomonadaceae bacterium]
MNSLIKDVRYALRGLLKRPGFTLVSVITLALGIGASTAIFSVVHAVLLRSLPYGRADRLVMVWEDFHRTGGNANNVINLGNFFDWKEQNYVFEDMAAFVDRSAKLTGDGEPEEVPSQIATPNLFSVLGVNPIMGRTFSPDDGKPNQPDVIVLSYGFWQRRFGGDQHVIGRHLTLNNHDVTVIGVLPREFTLHITKTSMSNKPPEIWRPWQVSNELRQRHGRFAMGVARLKPGVTLAAAQAEMNTIAARLEKEYPDFDTNAGVSLVPLRTQFSGEIRKALLILLGAVGFVLLIACANVANLLLARGVSRQKEFGVRAALGAGRARIVRQLLTESLILATVGGALGLLLAWQGTDLLVALSPPELLGPTRVAMNAPVLLFTLGVSLITGIIFGLVPAFEATRFELHESLKEGGKNIGGGARSHRLRGAFVAAEIALAFVLLIGAGLLIKSFRRLQSVDPGFNANNVLTMTVSLPGWKYDSDRKTIDFFKRAANQLQALPDVEAVGAINTLPFNGPHSGTLVEIEGRPKPPPGQGLDTGICVTDVNYFRAMKIPLKEGRLFNEQEAMEQRHVVVVNETFARKNLPGEDPIGKRVTIYMKDQNVPTEIIGVVADSKHLTLTGESEAMAYWPHPELTYSSMTFVIRTRGEATNLAAAARNVIHALDPQQPIGDATTMQRLLAKSIASSRFNTVLLAVFALVALVLAAVGTYGVMSYAVTQRTHEFGIRMALGAGTLDLLRLVLRRGMTLAIVGVLFGLAGAFALTRLITSLLFEVKPTDAITFVAVSLGLIAVALLACYIPARRATKVDPLVALRYE